MERKNPWSSSQSISSLYSRLPKNASLLHLLLHATAPVVTSGVTPPNLTALKPVKSAAQLIGKLNTGSTSATLINALALNPHDKT